jgi:hypothetical protein
MYRYVMGSGGGLGNLLKASEEFQQTVDWVRYPSDSQTPTVNANSRPDPNGGTTADQVGFTANTSARLQQTVTLSASTQYTFSVYARAVSGSVDFRMRNVTLKAAEVKTATTTGGDGGGFTRFTYTFTTTTAGSYELALQNDTNATAKDVIFWGAMLNQGGTAIDYEYAAPTTGGSAPAPAYAGFGDAFGGVTAYYSLRQFTEAETLNAIRVRRSSDDAEQDIGFDANGDLDSTALLAFVNADVDNYTSDFSSGTDGWGNDDTISTGGVTILGVENALEVELTNGSQVHQITKSFAYGNGQEHKVELDYYIPSGSQIGNLQVTGLSGATQTNTNVTGSWQTMSVTGGTAVTESIQIRIQTASGGNTIDDDGAKVYFKNIVVTQTTADGAVTTFYDQSGNGNHATNATASEQPLVVSGGTLVEENGKAAIDFDGVNDGIKSAAINTSFTNLSAFIVKKNEATSGVRSVVRIRPNGAVGTLDGISYEQIGGGAAYGPNTLFEANGNAIQNTSGQGSSVVVQELSTLLFEQSQILAYRDGSLDQTINNISAGTAPIGTCSVNQPLWIGYNFDSNDRAFDGKFQEIILFTYTP